MAAGDREIMKAMEETTAGNIKAMLEHGNESRRLFRDLEKKVRSLDGLVRAQQVEIAGLRTLLASLQQRVYQVGTDGT